MKRNAGLVVLIAAVAVLAIWNEFRPDPATEITPLDKPAKRPLVLVFKRKMLKGEQAWSNLTDVRPIRNSECDAYMKDKHTYLPPLPVVADFRILMHDVEPDVPVRKVDFFWGCILPRFPAVSEPLLLAMRGERNE